MLWSENASGGDENHVYSTNQFDDDRRIDWCNLRIVNSEALEGKLCCILKSNARTASADNTQHVERVHVSPSHVHEKLPLVEYLSDFVVPQQAIRHPCRKRITSEFWEN